MGDKLTKQDKTFVKEIVEHGNQTEAAKKAYGYEDSNVAGVMANKKLRKVKIQKAILTIAEQIPNDELVKVHLEGLRAFKRSQLKEDGEIIEESTEPDFAIRHKYLDSAYKLKGLYEYDQNKNINILMPVLVKFLDKKDDTTSGNGDTK